MIIEVALSIAAIWLGSLFAYSGSVKLLASVEHNTRAVQGYRILPIGAARAVGVGLPYAELIVGGLILLTPYDHLGALVAVMFGIAFVIASGSVLVRGLDTSCGCAGKASDRVTLSTFLRAATIAVAGAALMVADGPVTGLTGWVVFGVGVAPACTIALRRSLHRGLSGPVTSATAAR